MNRLKKIQNFNNIKLDIDKIPDIMYFGSDKKINELKNRVFLSSLIGIASMFIVKIKDIKILEHSCCNIGYQEWSYPDKKLRIPLEQIHITHNIKEVTDIENGISEGFIYKINVSKVKDKLSLFITNDPDREVVYNGIEPLDIIEIIPHELKWNCQFSQDNVNHNGQGVKY